MLWKKCILLSAISCLLLDHLAFAEEPQQSRGMAMTRNRKRLSPARKKLMEQMKATRIQNTGSQSASAQSKITEEEKDNHPIIRKLQAIQQFLQTDGKPYERPSGGIGWIALAFLFYMLSPILIPLLLSPVVVILTFFLFLPLIIDNNAGQP